jgi:hypothetical protein
MNTTNNTVCLSLFLILGILSSFVHMWPILATVHVHGVRSFVIQAACGTAPKFREFCLAAQSFAD